MTVIGIKDGYEKHDCSTCQGTGRVKMGAGYYTWKSDRRRKPSCHDCGGFGFVVTRKKSDATNVANSY